MIIRITLTGYIVGPYRTTIELQKLMLMIVHCPLLRLSFHHGWLAVPNALQKTWTAATTIQMWIKIWHRGTWTISRRRASSMRKFSPRCAEQARRGSSASEHGSWRREHISHWHVAIIMRNVFCDRASYRTGPRLRTQLTALIAGSTPAPRTTHCSLRVEHSIPWQLHSPRHLCWTTSMIYVEV